MEFEFRDIKNKNDELLSGVDVALKDKGCKISWTYPMNLSEVCVFEVPLNEKFSREKAQAGSYKSHLVKFPQTSFTSDRICSFAIFPLDKDGVLVIQDKEHWDCPIHVNYKFYTEEFIEEGKKKLGFISTKKTVYKNFVRFKSNMDITGDKILYSLKNSEGIFCLPFDLKANQIKSIELNGSVKFFTDQSYGYIKLSEVKGAL